MLRRPIRQHWVAILNMTLRLLLRRLAPFLFFFALGALAAEDRPITAGEKRRGYRDHTLIAKPRAGVTDFERAESAERLRLVRAHPRFGGIRTLESDGRDNIMAVAKRLLATGRYEYVEPDFIKKGHALPNDPRFVAGEQWPLRNTGQSDGVAGADIGAVAAWDIRTDASGIVVAVIDTGVRLTHEDLAANLWTNPAEIPGNGIDDDANGYVDDVHGINALAAKGSPASGKPEDDVGHGTAVASVIGAVGNNGKGLAGVAWQAKIMALKFDDASGSAVTSKQIECLDYAIAKGARIVNISYGSNVYSQAEYESVKRARDAGVIVVTSVGNEARNVDLIPNFPSNYLLDNLLAVAATDRREALADFSNYGSGLTDLGAPGAAVATLGHLSDADYVVKNGTSFATPHVTGSLALLLAQFPNENYRASINRLLRSVDPLPALAGKAQTGGRLNLAKALASTADRPFNDDFAARAPLTGSNLSVRAHNLKATGEPQEPSHAGLAPGATLWWSWTAPSTGPVVFDTARSGVDTVLALYTGSTFGELTAIASNDDASGAVTTSRVAFDAVSGTTYHLAIGGKNGATGSIVFTLGFLPPNDSFAAATTLTGTSMRVSGFNTVASSEPGEPKATTSARSRTVWYRWVAPISAEYSFSIFAYGFDAVGAVYTGTALGNLVPLDTASQVAVNEAALFTTVAGNTYYFQIDSADDAIGDFDLTLFDGAGVPGYDPVHPSPAFSPAISQLYTADTYGALLFLNLTTGTPKFEELSGTLDVHTPAIGPDGSMYIGDELGYLYAYAPNGTRRWRKDLGLVRVTSSAALGPDGTILVHTDDGFLNAYLPDGTLRWRATVPGESYSSPSLASNGTIYIGSDDQNLYALSPLDGSLQWKFKADGEIYSSPAIDGNGAIYFGTLNGKFYSVAADGTQRWAYTAAGAISSSPAIAADGTVYFGCYDYNLYALTSEGALRWKYATGDEIRASSPAIAANGTIYIGSYDGFVHAVNSDGQRRRVYATGAYIRSSPMIYEEVLFIGSGDNRAYIADIGSDLATSPWPMHRQNIRRTGGRVGTGAPAILTQSVSQTIAGGTRATLAVNSGGGDTLTFQWYRNGTAIAGATQSSYSINALAPAETGVYTVTVSNSVGSATSSAVALGLSSAVKLTGTGTELGTDIVHPVTGFTYDQVLLTGAAAAIKSDAGQIMRVSYLDLTDDIVQVEFSGSGTFSLVLDNSSGPAAPQKYNQAVTYMKGHVGLVVTGANESTNLSVFSVGRANAVNQTLFKDDVTYDGVADLAFIGIQSANGKFGGLRTANGSYFATRGFTGIYAPGVEFTGPVFVGDIGASDNATPVLILGSASDVRITGGDMQQVNNRAVQVSGIAQLKFTDGGTSHGNSLPAQTNKARFEQNGVDVTTQIVVNP